MVRRGGPKKGKKTAPLEDISDDEIDTFHKQRDKILLEGDSDTELADPYGTYFRVAVS